MRQVEELVNTPDAARPQTERRSIVPDEFRGWVAAARGAAKNLAHVCSPCTWAADATAMVSLAQSTNTARMRSVDPRCRSRPSPGSHRLLP